MAIHERYDAELAMLARWRPVRFGGIVVAVALLWPAARYAIDFGHFARNGLKIETDGASGSIHGASYEMKLPVSVYNSTGRAITEVTLWVDGYACPAEDMPTAGCRHIASFAQVMPMYLADGASQHFTDSAQGSVPGDAPGEVLKIERHVQTVRNDADDPGTLRSDPGPIDTPIEHSEHH